MNRDTFFFAALMFSDKPPTFPTVRGVPHGGDDDDRWAHLPKVILYYLLKFLNLRTDPTLLRSVCRSWRSSLPLSEIPKLPLGFDAPKLPHSNHPVLLHYSRIFLLSPLSESTSPWIVRVADVTHDLGHNKFQLKSPVDGGKFFEPTPPVKGRFNMLDCDVAEVSPCLGLFGGKASLLGKQLNGLAQKVVGGWDLNSRMFLAVLAKLIDGGLVFLKMGHEDWIKITDMNLIDEDKKLLENFDVGDIVFYDSEFYAFDLNSWKVGVFDPIDFDFDDVPSIEFFDGPEMEYVVINGVKMGYVDGGLYMIKGIYFVPSGEGLYLVFEMSGYECGEGIKEKLVVFELDEEEWEWNKVESIGEQVFFIGFDVAFSVPAKKLQLWKPGSICLFAGRVPVVGDGVVELGPTELPNGLDGLKYPKYWKKFRMFNMDEEEKGILGFDELSEVSYTKLFFPPPKWVTWTVGDIEVDLSNLKLCDDVDCGDGDDDAELGAMTLEEVE